MKPSWAVKKLTDRVGWSNRSGLPWSRWITERDQSALAAEEPAHVVAVATVPLHPSLIGPRSPDVVANHVPCLGDEADAASLGPVPDVENEVGVAGENRRQIESEPVDTEVGEPIERPHDQVPRDRRVGVDDVAAAGLVDVRAIAVAHVVPTGRPSPAGCRSGRARPPRSCG